MKVVFCVMCSLLVLIIRCLMGWVLVVLRMLKNCGCSVGFLLEICMMLVLFLLVMMVFSIVRILFIEWCVNCFGFEVV